MYPDINIREWTAFNVHCSFFIIIISNIKTTIIVYEFNVKSYSFSSISSVCL